MPRMTTRIGLLLAIAVLAGACKSAPDDPSGQQTCVRFREILAAATARSMSEGEVGAALTELTLTARDADTPGINIAGERVAREGNAAALIAGQPDSGQAALIQACDETFPE